MNECFRTAYAPIRHLGIPVSCTSEVQEQESEVQEQELLQDLV